MPYVTSVERIGLQKGIEQGLQQGEVAVVLRQLNRRFGPLSTAQTTEIQGLSLDQITALSESLLDFTSMADLEAWLSQQEG
ncbi:DUF4351 domain-containing protein [Synechococcus elongatus IITB7]|uniref:DUF4351 domain-containing protein n=1 Tax=Synechococcus elongatus TaxID=32046 RepID=UPI0030D4C33F